MRSATETTPYDFRLALPSTWDRLDLDPSTRRDNIRALVARRIGEAPEKAELRHELENRALQGAEEAEASGAQRMWFLADQVADRPVMATLVATTWAGALSLSRMAARLRASSRPDNFVISVENIELHAGPAVKLRRRAVASPPGTQVQVQTESLQYYVSVPGSEAFLVLAFSTPNVTLVEAFLELFDAIVSTLQWLKRPEEEG